MTQSPPSVLVVGGTSFIGRHYLARRASAGLATTATCTVPLHAPAIPGVTWLRGDLATPDADREWPAACDSVVALAQSRQWRQVPAGSGDVFAVNVHGAFRIAEYARRAGARRLIYASSGSVYDQASTQRSEQSSIDVSAARHFYVAAKLAAEALLSGYQQSMHVIVLRLFVPYGEFQDPGMLLPQIVRRIRANEPVTLDRDGGLVANPVAAADVAETLDRCLALERSATLNVAGPDTRRLKEIAEAIATLVGQAPRFELRDAPPPQLVGPTERLKQTLGWSPQTTLDDGLRHWLAPS